MPSDAERRAAKVRERAERKLKSEALKIEFSTDPLALAHFGPIITTDLGVTDSHAQALQAQGLPLPARIRCRFLVDTGADGCVVKHDIADAAGLKLIATNVPLHGVGVDTTGRTFIGRVWFGVESKKVVGAIHQFYVDTQIMSGTLAASVPFDGLIGRDVLKYFEMTYNGKSGRICMKSYRPDRP